MFFIAIFCFCTSLSKLPTTTGGLAQRRLSLHVLRATSVHVRMSLSARLLPPLRQKRLKAILIWKKYSNFRSVCLAILFDNFSIYDFRDGFVNDIRLKSTTCSKSKQFSFNLKCSPANGFVFFLQFAGQYLLIFCLVNF